MSVDLSSIVSGAFKSVGNAISGVLRTATYQTVRSQDYDPATGAVTNSAQTFTIKAVLTAYKRNDKEFDFQGSQRQTVEFGDQKCLVPYSDLPITPSLGDTITIDGGVWRVVDHMTDPTGKALHTFQIRQS